MTILSKCFSWTPTPGDILAHLGRQPSLVTGLLALGSNLTWSDLAWFDLQLRLAKGLGALAHEHAHVLTALLLGAPRSSALTPENLLGHVPLREHLLALLPGWPVKASTRVELPEMASGPAGLAVSAAGVLASAALLIASASADPTDPLLVAAALNAALALASDGQQLLGLAGALPLGTFGCGNWGLLIPSHDPMCRRQLMPRALSNLLEELLCVVELRGGQAGGVCHFFNRSGVTHQVVSKVVKAKRGPLGSRIFNGLASKLNWKRMKSLCQVAAPDVMVMQGHTRFGTSSPASVPETHPHQWIGELRERFWSYDPELEAWRSSVVPWCVTICHNGDFDEWKPYDDYIANGTFGCWLARVLNKNNPTKGDSPKIAGAMDLLICKGCWFRAVRFAYTMLVMTHEDQVCGWESLSPDAPSTMPSDKVMREWARVFEAAFEEYLNYESPQKKHASAHPEKLMGQTEGGVSVQALVQKVFRILGQADAQSGEVQRTSSSILSEAFHTTLDEYVPMGSVRGTFVLGVVRAFFQQDPLTSVWQFFCNATGTFGISVSCTAFPQQIVLAAKGQPITVGFNRDRALAVWTSEPVSLPANWVDSRERAVMTRFDLSDSVGEILEVSVVPKNISAEVRQQSVHFAAMDAPYFELPVLPSEDDPDEDASNHHILLRGSSMDPDPTPVTDEDFVNRLTEISFTKMDTVAKHESHMLSWFSSRPDPVKEDLEQIPKVLELIDDNWKDANSLNNATARRFSSSLCARANEVQMEEPDDAGRRPIDLLVTGVENSHWIGQQFVADMSRVFPMLNCVAISANFVVGLLQEGAGHIEPLNFPYTKDTFRLAPGAVCLALSHSGATYPTVWAARLLKRLGNVNVFALSGHLDTTLSASLGQSIADPGFNSSIMWTMAGIRPSESASVASLAMHHTLSHLLIVCAARSVDDKVIRDHGRKLTPEDIADLDRIVMSLTPAAETLCGVSVGGERLESDTYDAIVSTGKYWSRHLTEPYWATFWGAVYVYVTVTVGIPPVTTAWTHSFEAIPNTDGHDWTFWLARFIDATIYVFLAALICVVYRKLTGRRLWTRFTARTVVIVDSSTMNYKLLRAYISKLRALAFRFTTFGVLGQNPTDHFVHEMTHLTTSDALVAVGRPDGRLPSLAATEASVIMSMQQAKFIKKGSSGIEAIGVGHNPWTNHKLFARSIALPLTDRPVFFSEHLLNDGGDEGIDVTRLKGATPDSVISKSQELFSGKKQLGNELDAPRLTLDMLKMFLGGRQSLSKGEARNILKSLVEEQAEDLAIDPEDFNPEVFIPKSGTESISKPRQAKWGSFGSLPRSQPPLSPSKSAQQSSRNSSEDNLSPPKSSPRNERVEVRLSELMTIVRSEAMREEMQRLKKNVRRKALTVERVETMFLSKGEIFHAWHEQLSQNRRRKSIAKIKTEMEVRAGNWRMMEGYRTVVHGNAVLNLLFGASLMRDIFRAWHTETITNKGGQTLIGAHWASSSASLPKIVKSQQLLEHLYETRVGSAERLISFFILFHRMVKPTSLVPFLGYAMDKTESRLRVASTPAPVAMREHASDGEGHSAIDVIRTSKFMEINGARKNSVLSPSGLPLSQASTGATTREATPPDSDTSTQAEGTATKSI